MSVFRQKLVQMFILWRHLPRKQSFFHGTETEIAASTADKNISEDESMTLEAILSTISDDLSLPSTFGEIKPILFGKSISIPGVDEGDWYKASIPKINPADKGKATPSRKRPDELKVMSQAHHLRWEKRCCSTAFEGPIRDRGAVIARSNTNIKSTCWIRTMLHINGTWVIEPCADYWRKIRRVVASGIVAIPSRLSYVDTLPPVSEFFKLLKKRWADVCNEAAAFVVSGKLLPVGSLNFCRAIAVVESAPVLGSQRPTVTSWGWSQLCTAFVRYILFNGLSTVDIRNVVSTLAQDRSILRYVQLVTHSVSVAPSVQNFIASDVSQNVQQDASSVFEDQSVQMPLDQRPFSSSTSDDSSILFDENDTTATSTSLPAVATDFIESFARLRASIDQVQFEQIRRRDDADKLKDIILLHIRDLEKQVNARFDEHDRAYRGLLTNIHKDMHDHKTALSLDVVKSQQRIITQVAAATFDTVDVRKEVKELKAKVTDLDGQIATIRSELLDFRAKAEDNHLNLSTQLGFLVDYIRRGDAKKGEGGSSRPQPPPDDQNRPSGGR
ncbi:hypothetical protein F511_16059 [Dorcoceras hygrometricum]|uniref:Uncharacterized protein n=1 Tax=Dorcoceras hygrometricum TaxID=472368 RepID=A0A2Z7DBW9_9LAMI|nr:hypothetical protein F511_16059 [Dorcoceras hygrometricum]